LGISIEGDQEEESRGEQGEGERGGGKRFVENFNQVVG
jgi:hypothetical protein